MDLQKLQTFPLLADDEAQLPVVPSGLPAAAFFGGGLVADRMHAAPHVDRHDRNGSLKCHRSLELKQCAQPAKVLMKHCGNHLPVDHCAILAA